MDPTESERREAESMRRVGCATGKLGSTDLTSEQRETKVRVGVVSKLIEDCSFDELALGYLAAMFDLERLEQSSRERAREMAALASTAA